MIQLLIEGIAYFLVGYFSQRTADGKVPLKKYFFLILSISGLFCFLFEVMCLFSKDCSPFSLKEFFIEFAGCFVVAACCYAILYFYFKYKHDKVLNL